MKAILFDCDGTLADSFGIIVGTMRIVFERAGRKVPNDEAIHGVIGLSLETAIHRLAPDMSAAEAASLATIYRTTFHELRNDPAMAEELFEGVDRMLRRLAARDDLVLGIVTGKSQRGVRLIVERHRLEGLFEVVRTADDCPSKPDPAMVLECCAELGVPPQHTVVVGDSVFDMRMAIAAGAAAFGVTWGAAASADLKAAGAGQIFETVSALSEALDLWAGQTMVRA